MTSAAPTNRGCRADRRRSESPRSSLTRRVIPPLLLVALSLAAWDVWVASRHVRSELAEEHERRAQAVATNIDALLDVIDRPEQLQRAVAALGTERDVLSIRITAGDPARIVASTRFAEIGRASRASVERESGYTYPLYARGADRLSLRDAAVHVRLDDADMRQSLAQLQLASLLRNITRATVIAIAGFVLVALLVIRPIRTVLAGVRRRGSGHRSEPIRTHTDDEIASLAEEINSAFDRLADADADAQCYREALDQACLVAITDHRGRFIHVNDEFCRVSGHSRQTLLREGRRLMRTGLDSTGAMREVRRTLARGLAWRGVTRHRACDRAPYWADTTIVPSAGPDGRLTRFVIIQHDITARRIAEAGLRHAEAMQRAIVDSTPCAIVTTDPLGFITHFNRAAESLLSYGADEVIGRHTPEVFRRPASARSTSADGARLSTFPGLDACVAHVRDGRPVSGEWSLTRADGTTVPVQASVSAVMGPADEFLGFMIVATDISERLRAEREIRKRTEALMDVNTRLEHQASELAARSAELELARASAEAASNAKTEFLANVSHEIRTPMNAILGFADLVLEPGASEEQRREHIVTIKRNGEHLLTLINDILDLSKIEIGRIDVEAVDCSPSSIASDAAALLAIRARDKAIALNVLAETPLPRTVRTDPVRLRQILSNLLANGVKFTDRGSVTLSVRCDRRPDDGWTLSFAVRDTGVGIANERLTALFQPFVQADSTATRRFGGAGLGLALARRLSRLLNGEVRAESVEGQGSTFTLSIDVGVLDETAFVSEPFGSRAPGAPATESAPDRLTARILLVEDGLDNQRLISHLLRTAGATVEFANNGREAVDFALAAEQRGEPYDLVLMDMQMPVLSGYDAATELRQQSYARPIIALTAHAMAGDREKCLDAGCIDYTTKPVKRDVLIEICRRWLDQSQTRAA